MERAYAVLRLHYIIDGAEQVLCPVVLFGAEDTVLVDCGYPGSLEQLEEALRACGVEAGALTKLVLTHQDDDHMGGAAALKAKYPALRVLASPEEAPYIQGQQKNLRLQQAEALQDLLPEAQKAWGERFCGRLRALQGVQVDALIREGDSFDWGGGCRVLATPGHTPGHLSLVSVRGDFCVTGDAAVFENGGLAVANPDFCLNPEEAERSLRRLQDLPCTRYICYHGGVLEAQAAPTGPASCK